MSDLLDIPGSEQSIGALSIDIVANADKARKESKMAQAVEPIRQATELAANVGSMTPMDMLNTAVSQGAGIEVLEKLMALQERYEANQARKAFDAAISKAKAEMTPIVRNATGHNAKRYADFSAISRAIDPILSRYGLSYRFKTSQSDRINVTCILSHEEGHSEETTLSGPADTSGSKNAIQAIGSTLSYLSRYSLMASLGLAASNDDDGHASGKSEDQFRMITAEQVKTILSLLDETGSDTEKFCALGKIDSVPEMPASQFENAVGLLNQKKAKMTQRVAS